MSPPFLPVSLSPFLPFSSHPLNPLHPLYPLLLILSILSSPLHPLQSSQVASGSLVARIESYRKRHDITFDFALRVVTMHRTVNEYVLFNSISSLCVW